MKRVVLFLSLIAILLTTACSVMQELPPTPGAVVTDPSAEVLPTSGAVTPNVITATPDEVVVTPDEVVVTPGVVVVTPAPIKTEDPGGPQHGLSGEQFDTALIEALESKDLAKLRGLMGSRFTLAYWRSEGSDLNAEAALAEMSQTVLAGAAMPRASTGIDNAALLEGADPLAFFRPDAARAIFFDFVGQQGTDQALVIIGRDATTGVRYWKGILVAFGGFSHLDDGDGLDGLDQFSESLVNAFTMHDFNALRSMMGSQFGFARTDPATLNGSLNYVSPEQAVAELQAGVLAQGSDPVVLWTTDIPALLQGSDPLGLWGPVISPVRAIHATSLSVTNQGEGVLVIGRENSGRFYWLGILLPLNGEDFGPAPIPGPVGDAQPTEIRSVEALDDVNVRSGPGLKFAVEGRVRAGEILQVTGVSPDGAWWQFVCVQDASGRCWVSADPSLTRATSLP